MGPLGTGVDMAETVRSGTTCEKVPGPNPGPSRSCMVSYKKNWIGLDWIYKEACEAFERS